LDKRGRNAYSTGKHRQECFLARQIGGLCALETPNAAHRRPHYRRAACPPDTIKFKRDNKGKWSFEGEKKASGSGATQAAPFLRSSSPFPTTVLQRWQTTWTDRLPHFWTMFYQDDFLIGSQTALSFS